MSAGANGLEKIHSAPLKRQEDFSIVSRDRGMGPTRQKWQGSEEGPQVKTQQENPLLCGRQCAKITAGQRAAALVQVREECSLWTPQRGDVFAQLCRGPGLVWTRHSDILKVQMFICSSIKRRSMERRRRQMTAQCSPENRSGAAGNL